MTNEFKFNLYHEKGNWIRLVVTSNSFSPRIRKRLGKGNLDDFYFIKNDLENQINTEYKNRPCSRNDIENLINFIIHTKYKDELCLFSFLNEYLSEKTKRINPKTGKRTKPDTIRKYHHDITEFKKYLVNKYKTTQPNIISKELLDDYFYYLVKMYSHNTSVKKHHYIKAYLKYLETIDIPISRTYRKSVFEENYQHLMVQDDDIALTKQQFLKLVDLKRKIDKDPSIIPEGNYSSTIPKSVIKSQNTKKRKSVKLVLDCFLWMCSTGMYLQSDIMGGAKIIKIGNLLQYNRIKNNSTCNGIICKGDDLFLVEELMQEYKISNNSNFPIEISETTFKKHLKTICKIAGINSENVTPKTGRKTFASINYFELNIPLNLVSKMLGHQSEEETKHYLRITNDSFEKELFRLRGIEI